MDEFPHAVEYAVYAYLQLGDDKAALAQVHRLQTPNGSSQRSRPPSISPRPGALRAGAPRLGDRRRAAAPEPPASLDWDKFAWAEAVTWFAKGLGASHLGKVDAAREAVGRLGELKAVMDRAGEPAFAAQIEILRLGASGWIPGGRPAGLGGRAATQGGGAGGEDAEAGGDAGADPAGR